MAGTPRPHPAVMIGVGAAFDLITPRNEAGRHSGCSGMAWNGCTAGKSQGSSGNVISSPIPVHFWRHRQLLSGAPAIRTPEEDRTPMKSIYLVAGARPSFYEDRADRACHPDAHGLSYKIIHIGCGITTR